MIVEIYFIRKFLHIWYVVTKLFLFIATCESNRAETSLQVVYQLLQIKEVLPTIVVQRLQPHLFWTLDYAVRITGRLAKKDLQKVTSRGGMCISCC